MWTLRAGVTAVSGSKGVVLTHIANGAALPIWETDQAAVRSLALGLGETAAAAAPWQRSLAAQGWIEERGSLCDPILLQRLQTMDQRFAWAFPSDESANDLLAYTERVHASRRLLNQGVGQYAALPETVVRRTRLFGAEGNGSGSHKPKRILLLGDDDLMGATLAKMGHDVTVLDIDTFLIDFYRKADVVDVRPRIVLHDLREPLPSELHGAFDYFFADPLSTPISLRLFIARGLGALKPGGTGFVCVPEAGTESFSTVRRDLRFEVRQHAVDYNHYYTPTVGMALYVSDLFTLQAGADTLLRPSAREPMYAPGMMDEDARAGGCVGNWRLFQINTSKSELLHLRTVIESLKDSGMLVPVFEESGYSNRGPHYVALDQKGSLLHVCVDRQDRRAELVVAPSDPNLEHATFALLSALFGLQGAMPERRVQRHVTTQHIY